MDASRVSRAEAVTRELEQQIVDGALPAGEKLGTKEQIRRRFGVAVATVNEAIRLLEMRGLVEARPGPGGGVFVAPASTRVRLNHLVLGFKVGDAPFSDCLAVRNELEPMVCRDAARHGTAKDGRRLIKIVAGMETRLDAPEDFLRLNWELHRQIAKMCRNAPLKTLYLTLLDYVEDGLHDVRADEFFDPARNLAAHRRLVEAIISHDAQRVDAALEDHLPMAERWRGEPVTEPTVRAGRRPAAKAAKKPAVHLTD
jgi:DNA-binding FadR family transcriptional regulator